MPATTASATTTIQENQPNCHMPLATPQAMKTSHGRDPINDSILFRLPLPRALSSAAPKYGMTRVHFPTWQNPVGQRAGVGEEVHGQGVSTLVLSRQSDAI
jgi:hypothetical protein